MASTIVPSGVKQMTACDLEKASSLLWLSRSQCFGVRDVGRDLQDLLDAARSAENRTVRRLDPHRPPILGKTLEFTGLGLAAARSRQNSW